MNTLRSIVLIELAIVGISLFATNTLLCLADQYGDTVEAFLRDQFYDWQR